MNNTVPPGYKQTEVGVIPEDWEVKQVTDFCGFIVPGRNKPKHFDGDIPWITTPDLEDGGHVTESKLGLFVTRAEAKNVGSKIVPTGSIVMTCVGEIGIVSVAKNDVVLNQQLHAFIPSSQANSMFLMYAIKTRQNYLESVATKTALPYLNKDNCNSIQVPFPPLPEQRAIAAALSDVDALISGLDRLIAKKRDIKQAAMQQLLTGKQRLPGFAPVGAIHELPLHTGDHHGIPDGWEVKRLGEITEIVMGQSPSSSNYNTKGLGLPLIQGNADIANRQTIKRIFTTEITKRGKCGDVLMSVRAPVGEISRAIFDVCLGRGVCAIRFPNDCMFHYLISQEPSWARLSKGSTFDSVNSADVKALEVCLPNDAKEQTAIASVLSDMDAEITALEVRRDKSRDIKQGMMQELLTGRIRLV